MDRSPLIRLLPEIREYIYTFVLGNQDIDVRYNQKKSAMLCSVCTEEVSHHSMLRSIKDRGLEEPNFPEEFPSRRL